MEPQESNLKKENKSKERSTVIIQDVLLYLTIIILCIGIFIVNATNIQKNDEDIDKKAGLVQLTDTYIENDLNKEKLL
ncbi:MAG: hypothetical protein IKD74_07790 [Clostridia bacterium]|nr:hypothetical protein [Clostridia bacterium]